MNKHVLVAGSLHYDLVLSAERFPAADDYLPGHSSYHAPGGKGGNQAIASARTGARTWFAGRIGDDEAGKMLAGNLLNAGVDISMLQTGPGEPSGTSVAIVNPFGDFGAVVISGSNQNFDAEQVNIPDNTGYMVLQNELPEHTNIVLARKARDAGVPVIFNACPARGPSDALLSLISLLVLGQVEAEALAKRPFSNPKIALESIVALTQTVPQVAIMLGAGGLVHAVAGGRPEYHPVRDLKPQSMHGALDFFVGALASQMAGGSEFEAAVHYAQAAATVFMSTPVAKRDQIRATQIRARLGEDEL